MTSVAYPVGPRLPGWIHTSISLLVGWILGAASIVALYVAASLLGAMSHPYGSHAGVINEWPYWADGYWSLATNLAVVLIAVLLTTYATSWWLRRRHTRVSDGRLAAVLFFAGWIPLAISRPVGGLFGFAVAVVLVRHWVARHEDYLPAKQLAILVGILGAVVLSFGLLHPLWTSEVVRTASVTKDRNVEVWVHNAARVGVTIDRVKTSPAFGYSLQPNRLHLAPGADGLFLLSAPRGGCGTAMLDLRASYHVFGLPLTETLPARVSLGHDC